MKSVLVRLSEYGERGAQMSAAEAGVVRFVREQPEEAADLSIHLLAQRTFSSPSTIVRMCHRLGFDGYKEFRRTLQYELAVRGHAQRQDDTELQPGDTAEVLAAKVTAKNAAMIEDTMRLIDPSVLRTSLDRLGSARTIGVFGVGEMAGIAESACLRFLSIGRAVVFHEDKHAQQLLARGMGPGDVGVVFSASGTTPEMLDIAHSLQAGGATILVLTRFSASPLAGLADCCLYAATAESPLFTGEMSSRVGLLNLVDILYAGLACRNYSDSISRLQGVQQIG